jgi:hypothetical protein
MSLAASTPRPLVRLDVRPLLAEGLEPFDTILQAADGVAEDGLLELVTPFEPKPLYPILRERGFRHALEVRGPVEYVVRFRRTRVAADDALHTIAALGERQRRLLAEHGLALCCGGAKTLRYAAWAHGLSLHTLLEALQEE